MPIVTLIGGGDGGAGAGMQPFDVTSPLHVVAAFAVAVFAVDVLTAVIGGFAVTGLKGLEALLSGCGVAGCGAAAGLASVAVRAGCTVVTVGRVGANGLDAPLCRLGCDKVLLVGWVRVLLAGPLAGRPVVATWDGRTGDPMCDGCNDVTGRSGALGRSATGR